MRIELVPPGLSIVPGKPSTIRVQVTNDGSVISGHEVRVLGLDPSWVSVGPDQLSLFPDTAGEFIVTIKLPLGLPAGTRTLEIEVRELTPPNDVALNRFELTIPAEPDLSVTVDPASVTGGRNATVAALIENTGNSSLDVRLEGKDKEGLVTFTFTPDHPSLAPGEQVLTHVNMRAKRPWFGSPKVRPFIVEAGPAQAPAVAYGAWVQHPRFTRGNLALLGLLAAATVFAIVLSAALSQVVSQSNADRDLALQVAEAAQTKPSGGTSSISGTVQLISANSPLAGVTVDIYSSSNPGQPLASTATGASGAYHFSGLGAGSYKLSYVGAGFIELWYPESLTAANAGVIDLKSNEAVSQIDAHLGGEPATLSGQVTGADTTGALLSLEVSGAATPASGGTPILTDDASPTATPAATPTGTNTAAGPVPTIVTTQTLDSTGNFVLNNVPSPAIYEIVVTLQGYAPADQEIDLGGGENRSGIVIQLHKGDGSIAGQVLSPTGPLGGATIIASNSTTSVNTVSATTKAELGSFILASLPTPTTLSVVVSAAGYASQTLSVSLAPAQQVTGISITLEPGVGSISGTVSTPATSAVGGVTVTASDGSLTLTTTTLSVGTPGTYAIAGLPVPGSYTLTFSRADLASQTQAVNLTTGSASDASGVNVTMVSENASISGVVSDQTGTGVGEVAISLVSGAKTYQVTSADVPTVGAFEIDDVVPGTYNLSFTRQGGVPTSVIVSLSAGQALVENENLTAAASIYGYVDDSATGQPLQSAQINLYLTSQYPTIVNETTTTNGSGEFTFANVAAPQSFIVAVSYPQGASPQATILITTSLGQASPACGSNATGQTVPTTTTTTIAGSSTTSSTSTTTTSTTTTTTTIPNGPSNCSASSSPIEVSVS